MKANIAPGVFWVIAFLISQVVPFLDALLAMIGAMFDAFFGYIYWGAAWFMMRRADWKHGRTSIWGPYVNRLIIAFNVFLIMVGVVLFLGIGSWASVSHVIYSYANTSIRKPFQCDIKKD